VGNFGARPAYGLAEKLEMMGREEDLCGAMDTFATLEYELSRLKKAIAELADGMDL
jgi:hypothetical protein